MSGQSGVKWLVVIDSKHLKSELPKLLKKASATIVMSSPPVPLSGGELSIEVEGPADLATRLGRHDVIKGVYPSSDLTLY